MHENGIKSGSSRERENSNIGETGSIDQSKEAVLSYSRLPITRTFKGNRKKVRVIGSSKKIAESKVKNSFYCSVNILIPFNCRNVQ